MKSDVELRIERLERANRRFRWIVCVLALLVPMMAAMQKKESAPKPSAERSGTATDASTKPVATKGRSLDDVRRDYSPPLEDGAAPRAAVDPMPPERVVRVVDAEVFAVVDGNGSVRAEIGVNHRNESCLRMYTAAGDRRFEVVEINGSTTVRLLDANGKAIELQQLGNESRFVVGKPGDARPAVELASNDSGTRLTLNGLDEKNSLSLEANHWQPPQLRLTSAETQGSYRPSGVSIGSEAGNIGFHLTPGKRAAMNLSACPPVAGQEGIEFVTTPGSAGLTLNSLKDGSTGFLSVQENIGIFSLRPSRGDGNAQWTIRGRDKTAESSIRLSSNRGAESILLEINQFGPQLLLFNEKGESIYTTPLTMPQQPPHK